jgi:glutamyl-tRNA synthetase
MKQIITRFAPSPTGNLHIGSARTALFNYLFAKHHNGKFLLRIEDTDRARSTDASLASILSGLSWLGIDHDDEITYQFARAERHREVGAELLKTGKAYLCFASTEEINAAREETIAKGESFKFESKWRDADPANHPKDIKPTLRIKAPKDGEMIIHDLVQGEVRVGYDHLDDMILLRSDGTPTYMFAVVVDDHDMNVTHIIRGDDHLNNAFRQKVIFDACGWDVPFFAHIPLIHGQDGAKLSKRHGATSVDQYKDMGYLPEALCNYLLRLGWSHGDDEIISRGQAIDWFNIESIGKGAARFDSAKLDFLNGHYIKEKDNTELTEMLGDYDAESKKLIIAGMDGMKPRAKLLTDLSEMAKIYVVGGHCEENLRTTWQSQENVSKKEKIASLPIAPRNDDRVDILEYSAEALQEIENADQNLLKEILQNLTDLSDYSQDSVKATLTQIAESHGIKIGELMKPLRAILTGKTASPSVFEIISILETHAIERIRKFIK